jgi:hypothetical protein
MSLGTLVVQVLLTARVLQWLGVGVVLALLPIAQSTAASLRASPASTLVGDARRSQIASAQRREMLRRLLK